MRSFQIRLGLCFLFLFSTAAILTAEEEKKEPAKEAPVKIRYRPPEIMLVTSVDWPAEEKHRETMAKFLVEKGINCVEAATDVLDVCRRNGLYVRVGARNGDLGSLLKEIEDLNLKDDPAVFGCGSKELAVRSPIERANRGLVFQEVQADAAIPGIPEMQAAGAITGG